MRVISRRALREFAEQHPEAWEPLLRWAKATEAVEWRRDVETMSTAIIELDTKRYGRLLAKALPTVIKTEEENDRMLAIIEDLMAKGEDNLTPEEDALLELLVAFLLEHRGLKPSDLWAVLGSKSRVSEILSGKRAISKDQAKKPPPSSAWASSSSSKTGTAARTESAAAAARR